MSRDYLILVDFTLLSWWYTVHNPNRSKRAKKGLEPCWRNQLPAMQASPPFQIWIHCYPLCVQLTINRHCLIPSTDDRCRHLLYLIRLTGRGDWFRHRISHGTHNELSTGSNPSRLEKPTLEGGGSAYHYRLMAASGNQLLLETSSAACRRHKCKVQNWQKWTNLPISTNQMRCSFSGAGSTLGTHAERRIHSSK